MRLSESWPIAPTLPITIEATASAASAASQSSFAGQQRDVEEAQDDRERGRLGRDRHERGDRRRRALVDVGRPLVERRDRGLEGEAGDGERDAGQQQRVAERCRSLAIGDGDRARSRSSRSRRR